MKKKSTILFIVSILILILQGCNLPTGQETATPFAFDIPTEAAPLPTEPPTITHVDFPTSASASKLSYDVESSGTAPEQRAPYGDVYDLNRLERPFLQDMTYVRDLDIRTFNINDDADWYYISIELIGADPNNSLGIDYGVVFDVNKDGFGDFAIIASPPYEQDWTAGTVRVFADKNHDSAGASPLRSDAPFTANGYETQIFDGSLASNEDNDLAWVRINAGQNATVQFAVKRSLVGPIFMYGVFADGDMKDVSKFDYVDRMTEKEAGSPVKANVNYPLAALFAVDTTCMEAVGFEATGYEPKICPPPLPPTSKPGEPPPPGQPGPTTVPGCQPPPGGCGTNSFWTGEPVCLCSPF